MSKKITVAGREGISATIIADSINGPNRITTVEYEFPKILLQELNTHKMLAKNASSSRAIPVKKMLENVAANPSMPVYWGKNQSGMVAKEELQEVELEQAKALWLAACKEVSGFVATMESIGLHKQTSNRLLEPWQRAKGVITGTEWKNFFYLRDHPDAQPEFRELAICIGEGMKQSEPMQLNSGEWHVPYVEVEYTRGSSTAYYIDSDSGREYVDMETARMISASCCAQVSYRRNDASVEKAKKIYSMLNLDSDTLPPHASPLEHQATPMCFTKDHPGSEWEQGVSHMDRSRDLWSAMFKGWIQHRKLLPREAAW